MKPGCNVASLIEHFFTERLMRQRNVSANTIASYKDTFRLLFMFAQVRLRKAPSALTLDELDAVFIGEFLTDLETKRGVGVTTRNLRLTAIRAPSSGLCPSRSRRTAPLSSACSRYRANDTTSVKSIS
jgi:integrase/recombinase XerD